MPNSLEKKWKWVYALKLKKAIIFGKIITKNNI